MERSQAFTEQIRSGYTTKGDSILLGAAMLDGQPKKEAQVRIPLKTLNRHCRCNWNRKNSYAATDRREHVCCRHSCVDDGSER
jgi:hypothetical protein